MASGWVSVGDGWIYLGSGGCGRLVCSLLRSGDGVHRFGALDVAGGGGGV